ncbi:MAG: hypothetical protein HRT45_08985 [Bdellovibrionales bacterium]|nr:hypothetical protein [Bdellovibrionales bacterium]
MGRFKICFALLMLGVFSWAGLAETTQFDCEFDNLKNQGKLTFQINNLESADEMELNYEAFTDYEGEEVAFTYTGDELEQYWYWLVYGETGYAEFDDELNLQLPIDDISCEVGKLHLYANNGYRFGYLSVSHNCSKQPGQPTPKTYTKVACELSQVD